MKDVVQSQRDLIYDWNRAGAPPPNEEAFELFDETLRDGLQSPSVFHPPIDEKLEIIELMAANGIRSADIGMPGASKRAFDDVLAICRYVSDRKLPLFLGAAARTVLNDVRPVVEVSQKSGRRMEVYAFIGSSPIRLWVEGWDLPFLMKHSAEAIEFAVREGLEVAFVTEDTVRSSPELLERLFRCALDCGARRLVLCDTVGHATPEGTRAIVGWAKSLAQSYSEDVKVDWHGHNDRGLAVANAMAALQAGAHRVHACALGIGERAGNTSMDVLLLNLKLAGLLTRELPQLLAYARKVSQACHVPIPFNYPLAGIDAFRTASGVHAAAILKAKEKGDAWLADRVYSAVPAGEFGRQQEIEIGQMSGVSNVKHWLKEHGIAASEALCGAILSEAKHSSWTLSDKEVYEIVHAYQRNSRSSS